MQLHAKAFSISNTFTHVLKLLLAVPAVLPTSAKMELVDD